MSFDQLDPHRAALGALRVRLAQDGYSEAAVEGLLGHPIPYQSEMLFASYAFRTARSHEPATLWTRFWLLRIPSPVHERLSEGVLRSLQALGLIVPAGELWSACVDLYPCGSRFLFTDGRWQVSPDKVYHLGHDSYLLTRLNPGGPAERVLDLCTGSGVQAVAHPGRETELVDVNPRAVGFARLNLAFNGLEGIVRSGSLYAPVSGTFDRITANPPFVPTPPEGTRCLYQGGGEGGEDITREICAGARSHLAEGGVLAVVTQAPQRLHQSELDKLRSFLGAGRWGICHLVFNRLHPPHYIASLVPLQELIWEHGPQEGYRRFYDENQRWLESYDRQGIVKILDVVYLLVRLAAGSAEWSVDVDLPNPSANVSQEVGHWLTALRAAYGEESARFQLDPSLLDAGRRGVAQRSPLFGERYLEVEPPPEDLSSLPSERLQELARLGLLRVVAG